MISAAQMAGWARRLTGSDLFLGLQNSRSPKHSHFCLTTHSGTWIQDSCAKTCSDKPNRGGGDDSQPRKSSWMETCYFSILAGCRIPLGFGAFTESNRNGIVWDPPASYHLTESNKNSIVWDPNPNPYPRHHKLCLGSRACRILSRAK